MSEPNETRCKKDKEKDMDETEFGWKTISVASISACGNQSFSGVSKIISDDSKNSSISADAKSGLLTARVGSGGGENNGSEIYKHTQFWKIVV